MGSVNEEVERFYDTREDITSVSDSSSDCPEDIDCDCRALDFLPGGVGYKAWIDGPLSIEERRSRFLRWMGLVEEKMAEEHLGITPCDEVEVESDRIADCSGAVLGSSSSDEGRESIGGMVEESFACTIRNLDDGTEFVVDDFDQDGVLRRLRKVGSGNTLSFEEFERSLGMSPLVQRLMQKGVDESFNSDIVRKQAKRRWLKRISAAACIVDSRLASGSMSCCGSYPYFRAKAQAVKVRTYRKRSKELSGHYMLQDMRAHEGSILTMKFSPDGQYLASAGEDGIVRVWKVVGSERLNEFDICDSDPSYAYFKISDFSEIVPFNVDSDKKGKLKATAKVSVIFPQKVFHILEEPIHEFHGHCGEVLDLSWSKNKHLLSSSVDKTVRLWQIGCEHCLKVFSHNSYVTSIQFNPLDDNYFISGSIDGKVRIWEIQACQVVDWTDITEIVTAVCYRPDGKVGVVGSMSGDCRFYDLSDNRLQLYAEVSLQGKKKSPLKRITGFQFSPTDQNKLMVTSADSQVRILHGINLVSKYRGLRNAGSQIYATFTNDGTHIVSASEDSNVYVWNYKNDEEATSQPKSHWSCERFFSNNCSVAIPWYSTMCGSYSLTICTSDVTKQSRFLPASHHGFFSEATSRGSATWPEEKLPSSNSLVTSSAKCRSQHKFLKLFSQNSGGNCPQASWGSVIVTAGWDGRIRSFQNYGLPV